MGKNETVKKQLEEIGRLVIAVFIAGFASYVRQGLILERGRIGGWHL